MAGANKMTAHNMGIVLAPSIFKTPGEGSYPATASSALRQRADTGVMRCVWRVRPADISLEMTHEQSMEIIQQIKDTALFLERCIAYRLEHR